MKEETYKKINLVLEILTVIALFTIINMMGNNAVEKCVSAGNEYNYCVDGLK